MFGVPAFWLLLLLVPTSSFVGHFLVKAIRIEFFTPKQIVVSEHEYLTRHLSVEERNAIENDFMVSKTTKKSLSGSSSGGLEQDLLSSGEHDDEGTHTSSLSFIITYI